jgi:hypothetical protein
VGTELSTPPEQGEGVIMAGNLAVLVMGRGFGIVGLIVLIIVIVLILRFVL